MRLARREEGRVGFFAEVGLEEGGVSGVGLKEVGWGRWGVWQCRTWVVRWWGCGSGEGGDDGGGVIGCSEVGDVWQQWCWELRKWLRSCIGWCVRMSSGVVVAMALAVAVEGGGGGGERGLTSGGERPVLAGEGLPFSRGGMWSFDTQGGSSK